MFSTPDVECDFPPDPPEGGKHSWTSPNKPSFGSTVTYSCDIARKLAETVTGGNIIFHETQDLVCQWNKTWSPTTVRYFVIDNLWQK